MRIYGDVRVFGSGQFTKDVEAETASVISIKNNVDELRSLIYQKRQDTISSLSWELVGTSGSMGGGTRIDSILSLHGRLYFSCQDSKLYELNVENGNDIEIGTFAETSLASVWRGMIVGRGQSYASGTLHTYPSAETISCRPFVWRNRLCTFDEFTPLVYNASGHSWDAASSLFHSFNFFSPNRSNIIGGVTAHGKLYLLARGNGVGSIVNGVYIVDDNKVALLNDGLWTNDGDARVRSIFVIDDAPYICDNDGKIWRIDQDNSFVHVKTLNNNRYFSTGLRYTKEGVISRTSDDSAVLFDGRTEYDLGDWNSDFPGTTLSTLVEHQGYIYGAGHANFVNTNFVARIPLSPFQIGAHEQKIEDQGELASLAYSLGSRIESSGQHLTNRLNTEIGSANAFVTNASGDLYSNRARGWETVLSSPFATERRPYSAGVFHGEMLLAGTDEDTLWKVNFENKSVDVLDSGFTTSIFQGKDSDGQNVTQEMFISDVYIWDGDSKHSHGLSTPGRAQKILGNIYLFQDDSNVWRWDKTSITSFTDVSSDIVWNDMAGSWRISVDCRGFGFIYTRDYSGGTKYINKWNGNPDEAALVVLEKNSTEADEFGLFRYNNDVFVLIVGGTEAGKLYKYDWDSHTFTQFIADTGYDSSVNLGSNVAGALYNGDFHFLAQKKSNSEWHLVKFDGWNITLVDDDLPTIQVQHEMMVYNHHLYLLTYDHSVQNSTKLYRWIKSPLQDSQETSERVGRIDTRLMAQETPPSGWALPDASDWQYGDNYFHLGSGLYRRFVNPVGVPQWYQEVQHGRLAEVSEDNGLTGYTSLVLGAAGDWVPYVSNQASGSFKDCPGIDVTASGFTVNAGAAKCPISRGFWIVHSNVTFGGSNNTMFATSIFVNGNQQKNTTTHGKTLAGDHRISLHNQGVIHLADGDELTLRFVSRSASPTANIYSWNLLAHKYNPSS